MHRPILLITQKLKEDLWKQYLNLNYPEAM